MYRSRRAAQRRRRQIQVGAGAAALALVGVLLAVTLTVKASGHKSSGCAILDVSVSTQKARASYTEKFANFATEIGNEGSGEICVVLAAADPLVEAVPVTTSVAPDPELAGTPEGPVEIEEKVAVAMAEVTELLEHPSIDTRGSGLVEAANVAAKKLEPGDRIIYLSDGFEWSKAVGHLMQMDLSTAGIAKLIQRLKREGLLPDLHGITVEFPLMLFHPEGLRRNASQENRVVDFWKAWAAATGAKLVYEVQT